MAGKSILACKISLLIFSCLFASGSIAAVAADTIYQGGNVLNSSNRLISRNGLFTLGFTRLGSANYLGIWYNNDTSHPFWLGNRDKPIADDSGVLAIDVTGNMKLTYSGGDLVRFYSSPSSSTNLTAILEDSGNFVLKDANSNNDQALWQSFDYPTDSFLPGMKLGINHRTGRTWSLTSWLSDSVPAPGAFTFEWDPNGRALVIKRRGVVYWTSNPLRSNNSFENFRLDSGRLDFNFVNVSNGEEDYFMFSVARNEFTSPNERNFSIWQLRFNGDIADQSSSRVYGGTVCKGNNTDAGCQKWAGPSCRTDRDSFELRSGGFVNTVPRRDDNNASLSISDCMDICWKDCQCVGIDSRGNNANNTGCTFWYGSFTPDQSGSSAKLFVIVQGAKPGSSGKKKWLWILAALAVVLVAALAGVLWRQRRRRRQEKYLNELMTLDTTNEMHKFENDGSQGHNLKVYSVSRIMAATNSFSAANKLGQGGFGPVFKGKLPEGTEIAVKRLSRSSEQGLEEFRNELILIAKLQHTNLVRLLGCCIYGQEKMLVYEYMPNKSLDSFIFDQSKRQLLGWNKRFEIIEGIAQGLLYLHKYSRLRIIHRDLKASNILLDENLNPKISDFGMARIFNINDLEANTNRVIGTYGYMSPEYAMDGIFSIKSDVFSFGVLVLEILSGRKNHGLLPIDRPLNLVGYTWELWKEGNPFELVDPTLRDSCSEVQVLRCINVALLCVEDDAVNRPTMSEVISMLTSETQLPLPKQPAFSNSRSIMELGFSTSSLPQSSSLDYLSTSTMPAS